MTIKTRILLLVLLSVACLFYLLGTRFVAESHEWSDKQALFARMDTAEKLSSLVHELQKERGISAGYLASKSNINNESLLIAQRTATVKARLKIDINTIRSLESLSKLDDVREAILLHKMAPIDSFNYYTTTIIDVLGKFDMLAMYSINPTLKNDFYAHAHLLYAKEYLGEIRAVLNESLSLGVIDKEHAAMVNRQLGLHQHHENIFLRDATPGIIEAYRAVLMQPKVQATFEIISSALSERNTGDITAEEWFAIISHTMDLLRKVEQQSMSNILKQVRSEISYAEWYFFIDVITILGISILLIFLSISTSLRLLHVIKILVASIEHTINTLDFTNRIPLYDNDKIDSDSNNFNELTTLAEKLIKEKDYFATTDSLTGSYNRLKLTQLIAVELQRELRYGDGLALIMFDIDNFKGINEEFGSSTGDLVLKGIINLVSDIIRSTDVIARWGGEEFMILVPRGGCAAAAILAEKLRYATESHHFFIVPKVTASFGVSEYAPGDTMDSLCERVGKALHRAKHEGFNRIHVEPAAHE